MPWIIAHRVYHVLANDGDMMYDYSSIISWVKAESRYSQPGLSTYEAASMHDTTFADLSIRLGSHYLFQHQGITNIHMLHVTCHM